MRKRTIQATSASPASEGDWLDLRDAIVEVSSEDPAHPIERALLLDTEDGTGWRANVAGRQKIRLLFDHPCDISRIQLLFEEHEVSRTQQFVLAWSHAAGQSVREVVRQQWNFSPEGARSEAEDYCVELNGMKVLELVIDPDISGNPVKASLTRLRFA